MEVRAGLCWFSVAGILPPLEEKAPRIPRACLEGSGHTLPGSPGLEADSSLKRPPNPPVRASDTFCEPRRVLSSLDLSYEAYVPFWLPFY